MCKLRTKEEKEDNGKRKRDFFVEDKGKVFSMYVLKLKLFVKIMCIVNVLAFKKKRPSKLCKQN